MYILQIPNVMDVCSICSNPAAFIMSMNFSGAGNFKTDAGKYSYAPRLPEILPPIAGNIFRKYSL